MINGTRIKIIITVLFVVGLSVALYLRRPKNNWEPQWGKGYITTAENAYYKNLISAIVNKWQQVESNVQGESDTHTVGVYDKLLIIDLDKKALWMEENGHISEYDYMEFPPAANWILNNYSAKSFSLQKGRIILKNIDNKTAQTNPAQFFLTGRRAGGAYLSFTIIDIFSQWRAQGVKVNPVNSPVNLRVEDGLESPFLVTEDEYKQYINSLKDSNAIEINKENASTQVHSLLEQNQAAWKKIEKKLYMEIDRNVKKTGFRLYELSVKPAPDFSGAQASVTASNDSLIIKLLDKTPYLYAQLFVVRLEDNIWYAANNSEPRNTTSHQQLKLEFLIFLNDDITPLQQKEYINRGREKIKTLQLTK